MTHRGNSFIGKCRVILRPLIGRLGGTLTLDQSVVASIFTYPDAGDALYGCKHEAGREDLKLRHKVSHFVSESQSLSKFVFSARSLVHFVPVQSPQCARCLERDVGDG